MRLLHCGAALLFGLAAIMAFGADEKKKGDFVPMFNGKDLTGWVNVNCAPGTFFVKGNEIITTGKPVGFLRTTKQYENFIAEFEWMHVNKKEVGNSGFFVWADPLPAVGTPYTRGIEVQVLVNLEKEGYYTSQGDLFSIHGATCKPDRPHPHGWARCLPSERRCKGGGEWNHYKVIGKDGVLKLHVNGKEVSGLSQCKPRKGYLALESEGAECHFRNLKIKELPSTNPKPEETADLAQDFKNLYTGLDLSGWKTGSGEEKHWQSRDWVLHYDGKGEALSTEKEYGTAEFIVDFRFLKNKAQSQACDFILRQGEGKEKVRLKVTSKGSFALSSRTRGQGVGLGGDAKSLKPSGQWNRLQASILSGEKGMSIKLTLNGKLLSKNEKFPGPEKGTFVLQPEGEMDFGNLFVRELKKKE
jgi:hypothetical protein